MGDHSKTNILAFILVFWTICGVLSYIFADYLEGNTLTNMGMNCFQGNPNPTLINNCLVENSIETAKLNTPPSQNPSTASYFVGTISVVSSSIYNLIFSIQNSIPFLNLFIPMERIMLMQYNSALIAPISLFLNVFAVFTGFIIWGLIRDG